MRKQFFHAHNPFSLHVVKFVLIYNLLTTTKIKYFLDRVIEAFEGYIVQIIQRKRHLDLYFVLCHGASSTSTSN